MIIQKIHKSFSQVRVDTVSIIDNDICYYQLGVSQIWTFWSKNYFTFLQINTLKII